MEKCFCVYINLKDNGVEVSYTCARACAIHYGNQLTVQTWWGRHLKGFMFVRRAAVWFLHILFLFRDHYLPSTRPIITSHVPARHANNKQTNRIYYSVWLETVINIKHHPTERKMCQNQLSNYGATYLRDWCMHWYYVFPNINTAVNQEPSDNLVIFGERN